MAVMVTYKGPTVHRRELTRQDLESAGVEFPEGVRVSTMVWEQGSRRRAVDISDLGDSVREFFERDKLFEVKEGSEVSSPAHPLAGQTNPDGTNKAETEGDGLDHSMSPQEAAERQSHASAQRAPERRSATGGSTPNG